MRGVVLSYGGSGRKITVRNITTGEVVQAIAQNEINGGTVALFYEPGSGEYYALSPFPNIPVLTHLEGVISRPKEQVEFIEELLPFQVLLVRASFVQLGGDRLQSTLASAIALKGGVNNLGNQTYLAAWLTESEFFVDNNGTQSFSPKTAIASTESFTWLGNGFLNAYLFPVKPEFDPEIIVVEGALYPPDFEIPYFLHFQPRGDAIRTGVVDTFQESPSGDYSYLKTEDYSYLNLKGGNAPDADPTVVEIPIICNFTNSGLFYTAEYTRNTSIDYDATVSESFTSPVVNYFNNSPNIGDREETYEETEIYEATASLFSSANSFTCSLISGPPVFGFYDWVPAGNIIGFFSGENTTSTRQYTRAINEQWEKNISASLTREQRQIYLEIYSENFTYIVPSEVWILPDLTVGFQYFVTGTENAFGTKQIENDQRTPVPLLNSGDGTAILFTEREQKLNSTLSLTRNRLIDRSASYNYNGDFTIVTWTEVDNVVERRDDNKFYLVVGDAFQEIDVFDSFLFSVINGELIAELEEGGSLLTLENLDSTPIFQGLLDYATAYEETRVILPPGTSYANVEASVFPFWDNIEDATVYLFANGNRYTANITEYDFIDEPNPSLGAETIRTINSISLTISQTTSYLPGVADENEIVISPVNNHSVLLRDRLLREDNRIYCNLIGNSLYFAKSVTADYALTTQSAELYSIGEKVVLQPFVSGAFLSVTAVETPLGVSYFPPG